VEVSLTFNGERLTGIEGETIGATLLAHGIRRLRIAGENGAPRGMYCAIGHCFECQVVVDGQAGIRACLTPVREGMQISSMPDARFPDNGIGAGHEG
jgi:sarcosine oxidase subunit alpha